MWRITDDKSVMLGNLGAISRFDANRPVNKTRDGHLNRIGLDAWKEATVLRFRCRSARIADASTMVTLGEPIS